MAKTSEIVVRSSVATSVQTLAKGVRKSFPNLSEDEIEKLVVVLLNQISEHLEAGESIAFMKMNPDGTASITVLSLQVLEEKDR